MAGGRLFVVLALCILLTKCDKCHFGKHPSVPGDSCSHVIKIQPECYGENGFYWIKNTSGGSSSNKEYVYCDMEHSGGGWKRVVQYHSDLNTTCPGDLIPVSLYSGTHTYCRRDPSALLYSAFIWNENDDKMRYTEIRGYVKIKIQSGTYPRAFHYYTPTPPEFGTVDGIDLMVGVFPGGYVRNIFAYIVGTRGSLPDNCPVNGGHEYGLLRLNYRDYAYACDEIDTSGSIDSEGIFNQDLFTDTECVQCPIGAPWFEIKMANAISDGRIQFRMVNADAADDTIYLTDIEIYVR